ncbi:MAG: hypothetical protein GXX09_10785 [Syntrophomonadaceae bacterium]|nr:hypothetical protein [Syntrophomonadaceae bacterium]
MNNRDTRKKQVYDELATLVYESYHQGRLSSAEMLFLLEILETVVAGGRAGPLLPYLRRWVATKAGSREQHDISAIIKATVVNTDFGDAASVTNTAGIIRDLVEELEKLSDSAGEK